MKREREGKGVAQLSELRTFDCLGEVLLKLSTPEELMDVSFWEGIQIQRGS